MTETSGTIHNSIFLVAQELLLWDERSERISCQGLTDAILKYQGQYVLINNTLASCITNITTVNNPLSITPTYTSFDQSGFDNTILTGVRAAPAAGEVYISGWSFSAPTKSGSGPSFVYKGALDGSGIFYNNFMYPSSTGATVNGTSLYGPNNQDSVNGIIRVVGNYATEEAGEKALGCYYQGALSTESIAAQTNWHRLDPSSLTAVDETVINTIAHSTMGDIIVGNYDTSLIQGKAFIYNTDTGQYFNLEYPESISMTAYGVWHNSGTNYTITGGASLSLNADTGYLVDWDSSTQATTNWRFFHYNNSIATSFISHFEGITAAINDGFSYNMVSDTIDKYGEVHSVFVMAPFNTITTNFSDAVWIDYNYPDSVSTSANTVYENNAIGVYVDSDGLIHGYVAAFTLES